MNTNEPTSEPLTRDEKAGWILFQVFRWYWRLFAVFLTAAIAAFVAGYVERFFVLFGTDWPPHRAEHIGWVVGLVAGLIFVPLGWITVEIGCDPRSKTKPEKEIESPSSVPRDTSTPPAPKENRTLGYCIRVGLVGALAGFLLGIILGATFFAIWISITLSPLGPAEWRESLRMGPVGVSTSHPIVGLLWIGAMLGSAILGFVAGVTGAPSGRATASWNGQPLK